MKIKNYAQRPDSFKREYGLKLCEEVDTHNEKIHASNARERDHIIDYWTKEKIKQFKKSVSTKVPSKWKTTLLFRFCYFLAKKFEKLKKDMDIKSGVYSPRQRLVNEKGKLVWRYIK